MTNNMEKIMKTALIGMLAAYGVAGNVIAATYSANSLNLSIPDGNAAGVSSIIEVPDFYNLASVSLTLDISGGFNGDLYGYVRHNDEIVVLVNRAGRSGSLYAGYSDAGFQITLDDSAVADVHTYQNGPYTLSGGGQLTGTWQPDARAIDPDLSLDSSLRTAYLSTFDNTDVSGQWTLFLADMSNGGGQSTLNSWSLNATAAVPEPSATVLLILGTAAMLGVMGRKVCDKPIAPQREEAA